MLFINDHFSRVFSASACRYHLGMRRALQWGMRAALLVMLLGVGACAGKSTTSGESKNGDGDATSTAPPRTGDGGRPGNATNGTTDVPVTSAGVGATDPGGCGGIPGAQSCGATGADGGTSGSSQASGGAPWGHPLITGPDVCPDEAPTLQTACPGPDVACVYRGVQGPYYATNPFRCTCTPDSGWACANSNEIGETHCPTSTTLINLAACDPALVPNECLVLIGGGFAMGTCSCACQENWQGDGGAAGAPSWVWGCVC